MTHIDDTPNPLLAGAAWLGAPETQRVLAALAKAGATARVVGGAVRNTLLGRPVSDIDIATDARPEAVMDAARKAGLHVVATGIEHGTVTVIANRQAFEVTTLRCDVDTDGRHATVAFTRDWTADAGRRDFTINALYCDGEGRLFDAVGGRDDLEARRVRFIGDPRQRIREDYLRILRFFRFSAEYSEGRLDAAGLEACIAERGGLARLSAERVRAELLKLLAADKAPEALAAMKSGGLLSLVIGRDGDVVSLERLRDVTAHIAGWRLCADDRPLHCALLRLAAVASVVDADATALSRRLRLSRNEHDDIAAVERAAATFAVAARGPHRDAAPAPADILVTVYRQGPAVTAEALLLAWARSAAGIEDAAWRRAFDKARQAARPRLPFRGTDVVALGIRPGPAVGETLRRFEDWWIAAGFPSDAAVVRDALRRAARVSET